MRRYYIFCLEITHRSRRSLLESRLLPLLRTPFGSKVPVVIQLPLSFYVVRWPLVSGRPTCTMPRTAGHGDVRRQDCFLLNVRTSIVYVARRTSPKLPRPNQHSRHRYRNNYEYCKQQAPLRAVNFVLACVGEPDTFSTFQVETGRYRFYVVNCSQSPLRRSRG